MTYIERLKQDIDRIKKETKAGEMPLAVRLIEIDEASTRYAVEHAKAYDMAVASGKNPPINYKDARLMQELADLALYEDLTWSHPDKMSIIEYPIMTDSQREERLGDEVSFQWAAEVGTDGRDYRLPTRENLRKLR